jgi:hypothetical protein
VLVAAALRPGYLPQPFVIAMLPLCALVVAGALDAALSTARALPAEPRQRTLAAGAVALGILAFVVAPSWYRANAYASSQRQNDAVAAAEGWIKSHLDRRNRILVDDTLYVDLVQAGFKERFGVVWFYKLDFTTNLDPSIARNLPQGWRAFDYAISTRVVRSALQQNPHSLDQVRQALGNSRPVATFGHGGDRVEVRKIVGIGTGSGLVPKPQARKAHAKAAHARRAHKQHPRRHHHRRHHPRRHHRR